MPVNERIQFFLDRMKEQGGPPIEELTPAAYRASEMQMMQLLPDKEEVGAVSDRKISLPGRDLPVRIYKPEGDAPHPALVFYHGGGWVIGNIETHDGICRAITNFADCMVISVDYRLAPEHKFPAAIEDAYASLKWVADHAEELGADPENIAVGGDSAGGNLAAVASILAKEKGGPKIKYQLLIYPSTGFEGDAPPSMRENAEGYLLTADMMNWFRKHYFNDADEMKNPYASPILYEDLSGLPPAAIMTAEYDPLRDVGKAYAEKLQQNDVEVRYKNYEGLIHGFANFIPFVPEARAALKEGSEALKQAFQD